MRMASLHERFAKSEETNGDTTTICGANKPWVEEGVGELKREPEDCIVIKDIAPSIM